MVNGEVIFRERNKSGSINRYRLQVPDHAEQIFEGFGQDVPLEIQQVLGIKEVDFGTKKKFSLNFAQQMDGPFLLAETDTDAAKILGKLSGTEEIDAASKQVALDVYRNNQKEKSLRVELERIWDETQKFSNLPKELEFINRLSHGIKQLESNDDKQNNLKAIDDKFRQCKKGLELVGAVLANKEQIVESEAIYRRVIEWNNQSEPLKKLYHRIAIVDQYIYDNQETLERTRRTQKADLMVNVVNGMMESQKRLRKVWEYYTANVKKTDQLVLSVRGMAVANTGMLDDILTAKQRFAVLTEIKYAYELNKMSLIGVNQFIDEWRSKLIVSETEFASAMDCLGVCPLCGSKIERGA
jgi:uncharacterized protein YifE (UPF0438 family)